MYQPGFSRETVPIRASNLLRVTQQRSGVPAQSVTPTAAAPHTMPPPPPSRFLLSFPMTQWFSNFSVHQSHLGCFFNQTAGPGHKSFDSGGLDPGRETAAKFTASSAKRKCRALSWGGVHLPFPQAHGPGPPLTDTLAYSQGNATSTPGYSQYPDQGRREAPEKSLWYCPPGMGTAPPCPDLSTEGARGACPTPPLPVSVIRAQPGAEDNGKCKPPLITATWLPTPLP